MSLMDSLTQQLKPMAPPQVAALSFLKQNGFPTKKDEYWKYTSLKSWLEKDYALAHLGEHVPRLPISSTYKAVFVNGYFNMNLSKLPSGVQLSQKEVEACGLEAFEALNTSLKPVWSVLKIADKTILDHPLEVICLTVANEPQAVSASRIMIDVGHSCSLTILERHEQQDQNESFVNVKVQVRVGEASKVEYVQLQEQNTKSFHYEKTEFYLEKNTTLTSLVVALGALQSRSELDVNIKGPDVTANVLGLYALTNTQQSDHYTSIRHHVGGSYTSQLYKGLLDDKSKAVFNGLVYIAPDAQKANSEQLNKNLLLSSKAEINSKPELKIYADDVKASHGSTIGQLQKEELFYLLSRGIKKSLAIQMLSQAFVMDLVQKLENVELQKIVSERLASKLNSFEGIQS